MASIGLYTGGAKATKASYVNGCHRRRHLWNLLGRRLSNTRIGGYCLIQAWSSCYSHRSHHGYVQFRCQSVCLCFDKPTIQGEDEGNDMLWSNFISTKGSCCEGTAGHQNDRQRRTTLHGSCAKIFLMRMNRPLSIKMKVLPAQQTQGLHSKGIRPVELPIRFFQPTPLLRLAVVCSYFLVT